MKPLYFDYNATTPVLPRVYQAMRPYLEEHFGNPSSGHMWGLVAKRAVDKAREQTAGLIGCQPGEVHYTSCASESINTVLRGMLEHQPAAHLVTSAIEHPATLMCARFLEKRGVQVSYVGVNQQGLISPEEVMAACTPDTKLISIMLANNETGAIQPVAEIARLARQREIRVHTDAAQAVGKIMVDVGALGVDFLTVAGHKLYAPKGVGALYVGLGANLPPLLYGGGQEGGLRSGTENVPHLVGLGEACALAGEDLMLETTRQFGLGQIFLNGLNDLGVDYQLFSAEAPRLPSTMFVGFKGKRAADIISGLVGLEVGVSGGAACHGDATSVSHVLEAMNAPAEYAEGTIRFSWGRPTSPSDVQELLGRLDRVLAELPA